MLQQSTILTDCHDQYAYTLDHLSQFMYSVFFMQKPKTFSGWSLASLPVPRPLFAEYVQINADTTENLPKINLLDPLVKLFRRVGPGIESHLGKAELQR